MTSEEVDRGNVVTPYPSIRDEDGVERPSNEYVLNVAFVTFLGFTIVQAVFALIAKSESMLADSEAMSVDAMTYLFNLLAENVKHRPYNEKELRMPAAERNYKRKMTRLYMELIPPSISVTALIAVTFYVMRDAIDTLLSNKEQGGEEKVADEPNVAVMFFFSGLNLALDVVNVTCFARAKQALGISAIAPDDLSVRHVDLTATERTALVEDESRHESDVEMLKLENGTKSTRTSYEATNGQERIYKEDDADLEEEEQGGPINLNMCSAWTHVCADTMRSVAVFVAAGIAYGFKAVDPETADAAAALVVSFIIALSLGPLLKGLLDTAMEIWTLSRESPTKRSTSSSDN